MHYVIAAFGFLAPKDFRGHKNFSEFLVKLWIFPVMNDGILFRC